MNEMPKPENPDISIALARDECDALQNRIQLLNNFFYEDSFNNEGELVRVKAGVGKIALRLFKSFTSATHGPLFRSLGSVIEKSLEGKEDSETIRRAFSASNHLRNVQQLIWKFEEIKEEAIPVFERIARATSPDADVVMAENDPEILGLFFQSAKDIKEQINKLEEDLSEF